MKTVRFSGLWIIVLCRDIRRKLTRVWHIERRRRWVRACCTVLLICALVGAQLLLPLLFANVPLLHVRRAPNGMQNPWVPALWAQESMTPVPSSNIATPAGTAAATEISAGFTPESTTTVSLTVTVAPLETVSPNATDSPQTAAPTAVPIAPTAMNTPTDNAAALVQQQLEAQLDAFLQRMSPEERVGQLFVINILGNQIETDGDIAELIHEYHIGSVVLTPSKQNFTNAKGIDTPESVAILTNQLQALSYGYLLPADQALLPNPLPAISNQIADEEQGAAVANVPTMTETLTLTTGERMTAPLWSLTPLPRLDAAPAATEGQPGGPVQIPLFIGIEQLGDGYPTTALRRNFTPLPSQLALGSTWNPQLVHDVGAIVGQELSAVGINLLLGPSLDVVNQPRLDPVGALGIHSFGGDPYWVSQMGSAFISGIHEGSNYGLAAIARHFPGQGNIDRLPEEEVATVQQTLPELQRIALPPFIQVTRDISHVIDPTAANDTVDGLMTSHMRFRAFQGTSSTRIAPIGFSPELKIALEQVNIAGWHNDGGILMTPPLGTPAIRRYYQVPQQESPYRIIALNAFDAGHDLIYLAQLSPENDWEAEKRYIKDVIQFFQERYRTDAEFQTQIDVAVRRILRLKYNLYRNGLNAFGDESLFALPTFGEEAQAQQLVPLERLFVQADDLAIFEEGTNHRQAAAATIGQVARESITLLYPDLASFSSTVPAPQLTDKLLIFSDSRLFQECTDCTAETALGPEELKSIITRLYGTEPGATGQIVPDQVYGRSFTELKSLLDARNADAPQSSAATTAAQLPAGVSVTTTGAISGTLPAADNARPGTNVPTRLATPPGTTMSGEEADNAENLVERPRTANEHLQQLIDESNWIIFAMLDVDPENSPASDVVKEFLRQEREQLNNKQVMVLALNAPYFLDATEISKLTAYIGVYSKIQPFLESAVRVLFRSYSPVGAPAVSVAGTRFGNLAEQLEADPAAAMRLTIAVDGELIELSPDGNTPIVDTGSLLRMQVDQIRDRNGHLVPDGTPVEFHLVYENPELTLAVDPVLTRNGSASKEVLLTQPGRLSLSASVGEATTENTRLLNINDPDAETTSEAVAVAVASSTPATAAITTTVAATATTTAGDAVTLANANVGLTPLEPSAATGTVVQVDWKTLLIALFTIVITLSMLLILQIHLISRTVLVRNMLWATIFGLGAYIFYALGILPGSTYLSLSFRHWGAAVVVFIGMLLPLLRLQLHMEQTPRTE